MPPIGQILVKNKIITSSDLDEAIQNQVIFGGRIGTSFVELGYLSEQKLTRILSKKYKTPTVNWVQLSRIKPSVLKLFTKKLAKTYEAIPVKVVGDELYVVMANPHSYEALDAIQFATGKDVKALVLPELRIYDLLARFYKVGRELRYISVAMAYKTEPKVDKVAAAAKRKEAYPGMTEEQVKEMEDARSKIDFTQSGDLLSEEEFKKISDDQYASHIYGDREEAEQPAQPPGPRPPTAPPGPPPPGPPGIPPMSPPGMPPGMQTPMAPGGMPPPMAPVGMQPPVTPPRTMTPAAVSDTPGSVLPGMDAPRPLGAHEELSAPSVPGALPGMETEEPIPLASASAPDPGSSQAETVMDEAETTPPAPVAGDQTVLETPASPAKTGPQPYKEVAQAIYSLFMKRGVVDFIPRATLQEFLKLFVRNELRDHVVHMNYLATWMFMEADVPVQWLEEALSEFKKTLSPKLGVTVLLPGETLPEEEAPVVEPVEIFDEVEPVEELPVEALAPVEEPAAPIDEPAPAPPAATVEPMAPPKPPVEAPSEAPQGIKLIPPPPPTGPVDEPAPEPPAPPAEPPPPAAPPTPPVGEAPPSPAAPEDSGIELADADEADGDMDMLQLGIEDMASEEEFEAYEEEFVTAEPEEPEEEEEYEELSLAEAQQKMLTEVDDRRDVSRILLGFAKGNFKRSALFTVRNGALNGWDGFGDNLTPELVEAINLPLDQPGAFQLVNNTMSFYLGPMQPGKANDMFLKLMGGQQPNNVFIMPLVVNEKVVYMFYGDNGDGEFVPPNAPELQILAFGVPRALDMLLQRRKQAQTK